MKYFDLEEVMDLFDSEPAPEYIDPVHGRIIGTRLEAYNDVYIYEDGYEFRYNIGD